MNKIQKIKNIIQWDKNEYKNKEAFFNNPKFQEITSSMKTLLWLTFNDSSMQKPYNDINNADKIFKDNNYNYYFKEFLKIMLNIEDSNFHISDTQTNVEEDIINIKKRDKNFCVYYTNESNGGKNTVIIKFLRHIRNAFAHGGFNIVNESKGISYYFLDCYKNKITMTLKLYSIKNTTNRLQKTILELEKLPKIMEEKSFLEYILEISKNNIFEQFFINEKVQVINIKNIIILNFINLKNIDQISEINIYELLFDEIRNRKIYISQIIIFTDNYNHNFSNEKQIKLINKNIDKLFGFNNTLITKIYRASELSELIKEVKS